MPEVHFTIRLPGGQTRQCYSPSTVIRDYFRPSEEMSASEFLARSRKAMGAASDRVRAKHGFACASAAAQLESIEQWLHGCPGDAVVRILNI